MQFFQNISKKAQWWIEWISTAGLIAGVILTSYNIYPMNVYVSLAANFGWVLMAVAWRKLSLFVVQVILCAIYISGIYYAK